jgi:hypothetical protein
VIRGHTAGTSARYIRPPYGLAGSPRCQLARTTDGWRPCRHRTRRAQDHRKRPAARVFDARLVLSIPLDDWAKPALGPNRVRRVSDRVAPDAERLARFAERINHSSRPALVFGPEVDRSGGWDSVRRGCTRRCTARRPSPTEFLPGGSPLFQGKPADDHRRRQRAADRPYLPEGTELLHVTCDPDTAYAASGENLLGEKADEPGN